MEPRSGAAPRFSPSLLQPSRRLIAPLLLLVGAALIATSVANWRRFSLECEQGSLVAYRGLPLPLGQRALPTDRFPPIPVPAEQCESIVVGSLQALEAAQTDATVKRIDDAIESNDPHQLEAAAKTVEELPREGTDQSGSLGDRQRALLVALMRADLDVAKSALARAQLRMRAAEAAGVPAESLEAMRDELHEVASSSHVPVTAAPASAPLASPKPEAPSSERSL